MSPEELRVSVVVASRDRADLLAQALAALRGQTLPRSTYEVIVVDDGSTDATPRLLVEELERGELQLVPVIRDRSSGPAQARNEGLRAARAPLVAFTDDDCVADKCWLEAGLAAWGGRQHVFVQGRTEPMPDQLQNLWPFGYTVDVRSMTAEFETCNMFYPRELLERIGGFDADGFPGRGYGEDTDLAWRAQHAGAHPEFAPDAKVRHVVVKLTPRRHLQRAWGWSSVMLPFARHAELRRQRLFYGLFWNWTHYLLARALLALPLARRRSWWPVAWWLARPLFSEELARARKGGSPALVAYWILHDLIEIIAVLRGAARYRCLIL